MLDNSKSYLLDWKIYLSIILAIFNSFRTSVILYKWCPFMILRFLKMFEALVLVYIYFDGPNSKTFSNLI